ncbi:MAG: hypothetical protein JSV99_06610, partial [Planctomycetota bacterium]
EKLGRKRILLNDEQRKKLAVLGKRLEIRQPGRVGLYDAEVCADGNCRPGDDVNTTWYKVDEPDGFG